MFRVFEFLRRRRYQRRGLFVFRDDRGRLRAIDPWRTARALLNHGRFNYPDDVPLAFAGQEPEATNLVEMVAEVFGVRRYDESTGAGLSDQELAGLVMNFEDFNAAQKKNTSPGPISSPPTGLESSDSPEPPNETGPSFTASGSAETASIVVGPGASCAECGAA